jgi:hypothetical protein
MTDEGKADHWAALASILGAEPPPAEQPAEKPPQAAPPAAEAEPVELPQASRTFVAPAAQRTLNDWGRLAESLGIEVPLEVPEPSPPAARQVAPTEAVEILPPEEVPSSPPMVALESVYAELESVEVTEILPAGGEVSGGLFGSVDTEAGSVEATDREDRERPGRRRRRRRRRGRRPDDATAAAAPEMEDVELELPEAPEDAEELAPLEEAEELLEAPAVEREGEEGPERPRRRRRRRKRKLPARDEEAVESGEDPLEQAADAREELDEQEEPVEREEPGPVAEDESSGDLSDLDDEGGRASHHGIPTWEEAVGIVIAANVEARAKNAGGSSRNRGGRGRGSRS